MTIKILLLEDEPKTNKQIKLFLEDNNFTVSAVTKAVDAKSCLEEETYDLVILDIILLETDGITVCRQLRKEGFEFPILLITALERIEDKIKGFEAGADDYIIKPFDWQEFLLRIKVLIKREQKKNFEESLPIKKWGKLVINEDKKTVTYDDKLLSLTPKEFNLLSVFVANPEKIFNIEMLIDKYWDLDTIPTYSTVRSHIKSLRKKLIKVGTSEDLIENLYGMGYRLKQHQEMEQLIDNLPSENDNITDDKEIKEKSLKIDKISYSVWQEEQLNILKDVEILKNYCLSNSSLNKEEVIRLAHSLTGYLGALGFLKISNLSKEIEIGLREEKQPQIFLEPIEIMINYLKELQDIDQLKKFQFKRDYLENLNTRKKSNNEIVIVDDDDRFLELIKLVIQMNDDKLKITCFNKPENFLNSLSKLNFDLVLLDLNMPEMNGTEVCQLLRKNHQFRDVTIIFLTAYLNSEIIEKLVNSGANDFVEKSRINVELNSRLKYHLKNK